MPFADDVLLDSGTDDTAADELKALAVLTGLLFVGVVEQAAAEAVKAMQSSTAIILFIILYHPFISTFLTDRNSLIFKFSFPGSFMPTY